MKLSELARITREGRLRAKRQPTFGGISSSGREQSKLSLIGMPSSKWSNDKFLDALRQESDTLADACVEKLEEEGDGEDFRYLFRKMNSNDDPLPDDAPGPLKEFFEQTDKLPIVEADRRRHPSGIDRERIQRGGKVFMTHAFPSALVLLVKVLPEGYAAPALSKVLNLSGNLNHHPFKRLLGVLQMVVNISVGNGFEGSGKAVVTAQKVRLLHAGVRRIVPRYLPDYEQRFGKPVNLEDMLATIMGFSYLLITGLRQLKVGLQDEEAEDLYYLWRVFAQMMGIHPKGNPDSTDYVPANLKEASVFYASYARRHYVGPEENPEGVELAAANIQLMDDLLPQTPLRRLGLKIVPRIYMQDLIGIEGCRRVGIRPIRWLFVTKWILLRLPAVWMRLVGTVDRLGNVHETLSRSFFQGMINKSHGGEVTFMIPATLADIRDLAR